MINLYRQSKLFSVLLLVFFLVQSMPVLIEAWTTNPHDKRSWLAMLVWLFPILLNSKNRSWQECIVSHQFLNSSAVLLAAIGLSTGINASYHIGLAVALAATFQNKRISILWLATSLSWMPIWGVVLALPTGPSVSVTRLIAASLGSALACFPGSQPVMRVPFCSSRRVQSKTLVLLVFIAIAICVYHQRVEESRLTDLPAAGGQYQSRPLSLQEVEKQALGNAIGLRRCYYFPTTAPIIVTVVDGTNNRHAVHDLLYCLRGAGWTITSNQQQLIPGGQARVICSSRESQEATLIYWFSDGTVRHNSFARYLWQVSWRRIAIGQGHLEPYLVILQPCCKNTSSLEQWNAADKPWFRI